MTRSNSLVFGLIFIAIFVISCIGLIVSSFSPKARTVKEHYQLGLSNQMLGNLEGAQSEYFQILTLDPNYRDTVSRLGTVETQLATQASVNAQIRATEIQATAEAAPIATQETLELHYQRGIAYINLGRWLEAKIELEEVFRVNPNYKDVQEEIIVVQKQLILLTPTKTPKPLATPTPKLVHPISPDSIQVLSGDTVRVTILSVEALWRGSLNLEKPQFQILFKDYNNSVGQSIELGPFPMGEILIFSIDVNEEKFLSNGEWCRITKESAQQWKLEWEDSGRSDDFNDLVIIVSVE